METSVSLLIITSISRTPGGKEELVAVLQRRGEFNHETMKPETWPGVCQLTVHGKVEPEEYVCFALLREAREELGEGFVGTSQDWENTIKNMVEIGKVEKPNKLINHYAIKVLPRRLAAIRLNASTGGLRLVRQSDVQDIQTLPNCNADKTEGVFARQAIVMFPDEIEALKKAFVIIGSLHYIPTLRPFC